MTTPPPGPVRERGGVIPPCPGCGAPACDRLSLRYRYPRPSIAPGATDPCHVAGAAPVRTCGSVSCQAAAVLAVVDEVVSSAAAYSGYLLGPGDVEIVDAGRPGEFTWAICEPGEDS